MKKNICAIDDGYAYTKLACDKTGNMTVDAEATHIVSGAKAMSSFGGKSLAKIYETEEGPFTIGYDLEQTDTRFNDYPLSPHNRVMVHHILRKSGVSPDEPVSLAVSVPMDLFYQISAEERAEFERQKMENLKKEVFSLEGSKSLSIDSVKIMPEAASAYIDLMIDEEGNDKIDDSIPPSFAIVDIGGRTTDIAVMVKGHNIDNDHSGTEDIGVLTLINNVAQGISSVIQQNSKTGSLTTNIPIHHAENSIRNFLEDRNNHYIKLMGQKYDIENVLQTSINGFIEDVNAKVQRKIQSISNIMDGVVLIGGGSALLQNVFKENYPHLIIPDSPQFANVRGMYKYLKFLSE